MMPAKRWLRTCFDMYCLAGALQMHFDIYSGLCLTSQGTWSLHATGDDLPRRKKHAGLFRDAYNAATHASR